MKNFFKLFLILILISFFVFQAEAALAQGLNPPEENLIPQSATSEESTGITQVLINQLFYQPGSRTTKLNQIKDPTKVSDFTLDLMGKVRATFIQPIDLSKPEAVDFIANLSDYMKFEHLDFKVDKKLMDYFNVPLQITYYDLPFVWDPDVLKDDEQILSKDKLGNFSSYIIDDKAEISFVIKEPGDYKLIPHFELYIADNQEIKTASNQATFTGRISDPNAVIKIILNGKELSDLRPTIDPQRGEFTISLELQEGPNLIEAQAQSDYGKVEKITKVVQYILPVSNKVVEQKGISPLNIAAICLAILAILLLILIRYLAKKKRR